MSRFFVPKEFVRGKSIYIGRKEAHHILDVMRLKVSDEVTVFDGTGKEYTGIVKAAGRKSLEVEIKSIRSSLSKEGRLLVLIQAIPKKEKMDYITQKATELGVSGIIPVITERTIPEWNDAKKASVVERWQRIAAEAAKQCGRVSVPEISPIVPFRDCFAMTNGKIGTVPDPSAPLRAGGDCPIFPCGLKLIAALSDKAIKLKDALKSRCGGRIVIAIGPEGDFTPEEIALAADTGFKIVNLGPRVLRSDTAGLAVLSIINYEYTD